MLYQNISCDYYCFVYVLLFFVFCYLLSFFTFPVLIMYYFLLEIIIFTLKNCLKLFSYSEAEPGFVWIYSIFKSTAHFALP